MSTYITPTRGQQYTAVCFSIYPEPKVQVLRKKNAVSGTCWVRGACALCQCWVYWHDWGADWQTGSSHFDLTEALCCCSYPAWETPTRLRRQRDGYVHVRNVCNCKQKQGTVCRSYSAGRKGWRRAVTADPLTKPMKTSASEDRGETHPFIHSITENIQQRTKNTIKNPPALKYHQKCENYRQQ